MAANIVQIQNPIPIPGALRSLKGWLLWKYVLKPGDSKPRKVPFYINGTTRQGTQGDKADRANLATADAAMAAYRKGGWDGLGFAMMPEWDIVALDFDNCVVDGEIDPKVSAMLLGTYAEFSPSRTGVHAFMRGELADRKSTTKDGVFGFEVFCAKGFLTFTGHATPDTEMLGCEDVLAPVSDAVRKLYRERFGQVVTTNATAVDADDPFAMALPVDNVTLENAADFLEHMDVNEYQEWVEVGMALHHQFAGSAEALAIWDTWSKTGTTYQGVADLEGRWVKFGRSQSRTVTFRTLIKKHKERNLKASYKVAEEWVKEIKDAPDEFAVREMVCAQIQKDDRLSKAEREKLASVVKDKLAAIGSKYPIAMCREFVAPTEIRKTRNAEIPEWLKGWVYVTEDDKFFRYDSDEWLTMQGFNAKFNRHINSNDDAGDNFVAASWVALNELHIPIVTRAAYLPWAEDVFHQNGTKCVNLYRPSSVPEAADVLTGAGKLAVQYIKDHVCILCGHRENIAQTLLMWIAYCVQNPGKKIRFSPLIKGIPGDGKSVLGNLIAAVMGGANVRTISPQAIQSDFTGWAEGSCVGVLEEVKLTGHNRHDVFNALKPLVTNLTIPIHRKGVDEYNITNTTNYLAFTNHPDALPLDDVDRRWLVIFTPFTTTADIDAAYGKEFKGDASLYFDRLHKVIEDQPAALRRFFLDFEIPDSFKPNGRAPDTPEKSAMVASGVADDERAARELIDAGCYGVCADVVSSSDLTAALAVGNEPIHLESVRVNRLMQKLGFLQVPKPVKWDGKTRRVWVRGYGLMDNDLIRKRLDSTKKGDFDIEDLL